MNEKKPSTLRGYPPPDVRIGPDGSSGGVSLGAARPRPEHLAPRPVRHVVVGAPGRRRPEGRATGRGSDAPLPRALRRHQRRQAQPGAEPQEHGRQGQGAGTGDAGRRGRRGIPPRGRGPTRTRRSVRAGAEPGRRLLLHIGLRPARPARAPPRPRRELPRLVRGVDARGRDGHQQPAAPHRRPGRGDDGRLRDLRRRPGPHDQWRRDLPRRLHDRRARHLDRPRRSQTGRRRRRRQPGRAHPGVRPLLHGGRRADRAGRHERAALLGEPVRGARPRAGLRTSASTNAAGGVPSSNTPSPRPSPPRPGTSWWPAWPPPACPSPRCSTAGACWRPPRSPGSRSASPFPKRHGPSPRSTSTAARASPDPVDA